MVKKSLLLALLAALPVLGQPGSIEDAAGAPVDVESFYQKLCSSRVVHLGERHDREHDHRSQLEILEQLHRRGTALMVGLEMVQQPFQSVLDAYIAGDLDEEGLRRGIEWDKRWKHSWELYAPIFRFAHRERIPLLALNAPTELARAVGEQGGKALWSGPVPGPEEILLGPAGYRKALEGIHARHHGRAESFFDFFLGQLLWDETMAARVAAGLEAHPDRTIGVLAGSGHIAYGFGIPSRIERRISVPQTRVLFSRDLPFEGEGPATDFFFLAEE